MSLQLTNIEIEQFLSDAHAEFQSTGFLLDECVRMQSGTKGKIVNFPVFGSGLANQKSPQDDVTPLNISSREAQCTIQDWYAPEYVDRSFIDKIAVNATQEYSSLCAQALGRRSDQLIIDQIAGANYGGGNGQGNSVAANGTAFTYEKFTNGFKFLRKKAAAKGENYLIMNATGEQNLLQEIQLTNSFYVPQQALAGNGLDGMPIMGVKIIVIPDMDEGGIPDGVAYMFNKQAVGYAANEKLGGTIGWVDTKASYLINMWLEAGAVAIDPTGMVEINYV